MTIRNRHSVDRTICVEVSQMISEYFWKERYADRKLGVGLAILQFKEYIAGSDGV